MQPYFLPYIGYFQLIGAVDVFVAYDNIKYTKKGWINRNRMLQNGKDVMFTLPLKNNSDFADVRERQLADDYNSDKILNQMKGAYRRAPYFEQTFHLIEQIVRYDEVNLFKFIGHAIIRTCEHIGITTEIKVSSDVAVNHALKGKEKVLALCHALGADTYINPIGGVDLYSKDEFRAQGIELKFLQPKPFEYAQFGNEFVPWLSIVDVMMFNSVDLIHERVNSGYELI